MADKEKQIEGMAKVIENVKLYGIDNYGRKINHDSVLELAEELLKHYQPKLPEGSVVLSKEVFEDYMRDARQVEEGAKVCYNCHNEYAEKIDQARKETARAFWYIAVTQINDIVNVSPDNEKGLFEAGVKLARGRVLRVLNEVLKQFGVEVEE